MKRKFGKHAKKCFRWEQIFLDQTLKIIKRLKTFFKKPNCSSGYVGGSFYEHAELFLRIHFLWLKIRKQVWKKPFWKKHKFSTKQSSARAECNFENSAKNFDRNRNSSAHTLETNIKQLDSSKLIITREKPAWHGVYMFGSPDEKTWPKIWKVFCSNKM